MRHQKRGRKLNRTASHRKALFSNMAASLVFNKRIITTHPKAKELQSFVERLVTYAKKNDVHGRRLIQSKIIGKLSKSVANELMHNIAPQYTERNGGYTRVIKLDNRKNDDAVKALIEFVKLKTNDDTSDQKETKEETKIITEKS
ncbi:MAG: 50S ribosomal protein L17 [Candidatus Marinimicrobia bacterium]|nr:50S ribosomal protein L17 [Candidatus Neomarinimicrobiota bacterium]|tara:strand:+ start:52 stop:486 length:435 start_codon:yes stop_codon:yes gene_type:complete